MHCRARRPGIEAPARKARIFPQQIRGGFEKTLTPPAIHHKNKPHHIQPFIKEKAGHGCPAFTFTCSGQ